MTKTLLLVGSPRGKKSTSNSISNYLEPLFQEKGLEPKLMVVRNQLLSDEKLSQMLDAIEDADILILTAPLYDDCQPAPVAKLMESIIIQQRKVEGKLFIPIINCGFPGSHNITAAALPIYRRFAFKAGMKWGGSIAISAGEGFGGRYGKQLNELGGMAISTRVTLEKMVGILAEGKEFSDEVIEVLPSIFQSRLLGWFFIWLIGRSWWKSEGKKHVENVNARPYSQ